MRFLSNYPMKTQLLTYSTIFIIVVSALTYLTGYVGGQYIIQDFLRQSDTIYDRLNSNKSSLTNYYLKYLNSYFELNSNPLIILNKIYLNYLGNLIPEKDLNIYNFGGVHPLPSVLADKKNKQFSNSIFCYAFKQEFQTYNTESIQEVAFADFLGPIGQVVHSQFDENKPLLYGYVTTSPKILYSYPCYSYGESFDEYLPESRPWFQVAQNASKKTLENLEYEYEVSDPYLFNQAKQIGITLSFPLIDKQFQFKGAWCMDIFPEYIILKTEKMTSHFKSLFIMILSRDGMIIKDNDNKLIYPVYFYNQSLTGFDLKQWQTLQETDFEEYQFENTLKGTQQSIIKFYLKKQQLYILFIIDSKEYTHYLQEYQIEQNKKINDYLQLTLILLLMCFLGLILVAYLIITFLIMKPIEEIIWFFQVKESKTLKEKYQHMLKTRFRYRSHIYISPTIRKLQEAAYRLNYWNFKNKKQKNIQCNLLQLFKFPKNNHSQKICLKNFQLIDKHQNLELQEFLDFIRQNNDQG